jgi:hypothetical protein
VVKAVSGKSLGQWLEELLKELGFDTLLTSLTGSLPDLDIIDGLVDRFNGVLDVLERRMTGWYEDTVTSFKQILDIRWVSFWSQAKGLGLGFRSRGWWGWEWLGMASVHLWSSFM